MRFPAVTGCDSSQLRDAPPSRRLGLTLIESVMAMAILSTVVLAMCFVSSSGHAHLAYGETSLRATRLAEELLEEIESRPYDGSGAVRAQFHVDDYHGMVETPGNVRDHAGELCDAEAQAFSRAVTVTPITRTIAQLSGAVLQGKDVAVTVTDGEGQSWTLSRFIPEPVTP